MAKTDVQIEIDRPAGPYYAGDMVRATITLENEKELTVRGAGAYLIMAEQYKYRHKSTKGHTYTHTRTDEIVHDSTNLEREGTIPAGLHSYSAELRLPAEVIPPFPGEITNNHWIIKAKFDCPKAFDPEAELEVPVIVPPPGLKAQADEHGQERSEEVDLRLWLPRLEWVEGEELEGAVLVRPQASFGVTEIRVELLLTEYVPASAGNTRTHSQGKATVAGKVDFTPGEDGEYAFTLPIPKEGKPTRTTELSTTTWTLKATLARKLRRDTEIMVDIEVYNGPGRH